MRKENGFVLMLRLRRSFTERTRSRQVVSQVNQLLTSSYLRASTLTLDHAGTPIVNASAYQNFTESLKKKNRKAQARARALAGYVSSLSKDCNPTKNPSDSAVVLKPKNGNNKKARKKKQKKKDTTSLLIKTPNGTSIILEESRIDKPKGPVMELEAALKEFNYQRDCWNPWVTLQIIKKIHENVKRLYLDGEYRVMPGEIFGGVVNAVVDSMTDTATRHPGELKLASIAYFGCQILSCLVQELTAENRSTIGLPLGGIDALLICMEQHKGNVVVQTETTKVLRQILMDPKCYKSSLGLEKSLAKPVLKTVSVVMMDHPDDAAILANTCFILYACSKSDEETFKKVFEDEGPYQQICAAIESHKTNFMVQLGSAAAGSKSSSDAFDRISSLTMERMVSSLKEGIPYRYRLLAVGLFLTCATFKPSRMFDILDNDSDAADSFLDSWGTSGGMAPRLYSSDWITKTLHSILVRLVTICTQEVIRKHHRAIVDFVVYGMQNFVGNFGVEYHGCRLIEMLSMRSPEAKLYMLWGDHQLEGPKQNKSCSYGEADNVLFALVQRERASKDGGETLFQLAGALMFKLRDID